MGVVIPVLLSGGAGSRLWPLSREQVPKQLLAMVGANTMLQETLRRAQVVAPDTAPWVICNAGHRFAVAEQASAIGRAAGKIILEPEGRNTAPAIAVAALAALADAGSTSPPLLLILPADHVIRDDARFALATKRAVALAEAGHLVTFGVVPTRAETGYGYIRAGMSIGTDGSAIDAFVEKPNAATAAEYLASGRYLWNSGMFLMRADVVLRELSVFEPDLVRACETAFATARIDGVSVELSKEAFGQARSISIDYALMERTRHAAIVPLDAGWSDVGAWDAVQAEASADAEGNVVQGDTVLVGTRGSYVRSSDRLVAVVGLDDVVVVDTPDALLVASRARAQDVKHVVDRLRSDDREETRLPHVVPRPWGTYQSIDRGDGFQAKRIVVRPGQRLSLQKHAKRAEHWIVVAGEAMVTVDERRFRLAVNESTFIPLGSVHRLENEGAVDLVLIEVQVGGYLGEDDIVRLEDVYGRVK